MTRMNIAVKAEAEAKARARREFISGDAIPDGMPNAEGSSGTITVSEDDVMPEALEQASGPREVGDLKEHPVLRVLYRLAKTKATGLLSLEGRAGVLKEAYITEGQPQFINSNVESERLGNFLLPARGDLTPQALARAVSVMHHFGGRLADTLVGLDLLDPLEAYRPALGRRNRSPRN